MDLQSINLSNFKGQKSASYQFDGNNYTLTGENGTGKTSVLDGYMWLLFGKDSTGRSAFDVRPHDKNKIAIPGLVVGVEAIIEHNGNNVTLKKENTEKRLRGELTGFESACWIDGEPKKVGEFNKYISEIIEEETFKMLTDLTYFNKMHHTDRRVMLLAIAGEIGTPGGFEDYIAGLNGKEVKSRENIIKEIRKKLIKEQKESTPRIDELTNSLEDYTCDESSDDLNGLRVVKEKLVAGLRKDRLDIVSKEAERNLLITKRNELLADKSNRETELKNDKSGVQKYIDEKTTIITGLGSIKLNITGVNQDILGVERDIKNLKIALDLAMRNRNDAADAIDKLEDSEGDKCPRCDYDLGTGSRENKIAELTEQGKQAFQCVKDARKKVEEKQPELDALNDSLEKYQISLNDAETARTERFAVIDEIIDGNETVDPESDEKWTAICDSLCELNRKIGDSVSDQIQAIDEKRVALNREIADINIKLANFDNAKRTRTRIEELKERETELGEKIIEIDGELATINEYKTAQNSLISDSVNKLFKHVTFRMFKKNIGNDDIVDDCTAIYRATGTAYPDCSGGEKIHIGIDCINTLSKHFKLNCPLFIDNAESFTKPIEYAGQFIRLVADEKVKTLIAERLV